MRKLKIAIAIAIMGSSLAYAAPAKRADKMDRAYEGVSSPVEHRIHRYTYSSEVIYRILAVPKFHVHIELGEDEGLKENPVVGDSIQWRVSGGPRNLYVKPTKEDITTSMTVVTNKRTYQFQLISGGSTANVYQKVSFDYPDREAEIKLREDIVQASVQAEQTRLQNQVLSSNTDPSSLNFNYNIEGEASFRPTAVYSDGKFTYLRLPATQDSPAIFLLDDNGNPSLINYKVRGNMIVVERVAKHLLLKLGQVEVKVSQHEPNRFWR